MTCTLLATTALTCGLAPEARRHITYDKIKVPLDGGERATPRKPTYRAADLGYGPLHPKAMLSPRGAPKMIGISLLEAIAA